MYATLENKIKDYLVCKQLDKAREHALLWASETPTATLWDLHDKGQKFNQIHAIIRVACKREMRSRRVEF